MGVQGVVTGYVRQLGEEIALNVQLVDIRANRIVWGDRFTRTRSNLLEIEEQFATEIAAALGLQLTGEETNELTKRYTDNTEAYQLYLRGRYQWNQRSKEGFERAIGYFNQAIDLDPDYALAYAGLADSHSLQGNYLRANPRESYAKAERAATKAVELDDLMAEGHVSLGFLRLAYERDWVAAEKALERALELNPKYSTAYHWYGLYLNTIGRSSEALAAFIRAQTLDPLSPQINAEVGLGYLNTGQYALAIEQLKKTLEMEPDFASAYAFLGLTYVHQELYEEALPAIQKATDLGGIYQLRNLGYYYGLTGQRNKALEVIETLRSAGVPPTHVATVYTGLGDNDTAFEWLNRGLEEGVYDTLLWIVPFDLSFLPLRDDPRWNDLLRRMNLEP